jgi:uncharacterized protein
VPHPIVHIEIPAGNTSEAGKFYSEVFDWKTETDQTYNYTMFQAEGGPGGGFIDVPGNGPIENKLDSILIYLGTDDIEATLAKIEAHGGKTLLPKTEIPHVGWWAVFSDPSGNRLALFKEAQMSS